MDFDTADARDRAEWASLAKPQAGVDAIAGSFPSISQLLTFASALRGMADAFAWSLTRPAP